MVVVVWLMTKDLINNPKLHFLDRCILDACDICNLVNAVLGC